MNSLFFDGITCIREDLIEEAQIYVFQRRKQVWKRYVGLAAGVLLVVGVGWNMLSGTAGFGGMANLESEDGSVSNGASSDNTVYPGEVCKENTFTADVVETGEGYIVVIPLHGNGFWSVADRVTVLTDQVEELPEIQPGDHVQIVFRGEAEPDRVTGATVITVLP